MSILKRNKTDKNSADQSGLSEMVLKNIHDGVIITDKSGVVQFINPAGITMTECGSANSAVGLDYGLILKLETKEGRELPEAENPLIIAMNSSQPLDAFQCCIIASQSDKRIPVSISVLPIDNMGQNRIITFRDITKELAEEGEQTEFISTASHEMRTPVATIDGYLSLCLNPQTATIDERARGYLTAAEKASKHLGKLFQDLLDITKLDDGKIRPNFQPAEMVELVKTIFNDHAEQAKEAKLSYTFGSDKASPFGGVRQMSQVVYGFVDIDFMREILDNLIDNAIKYTPAGGSIYVNVRGDGDRTLINVTDTGIGISADDLVHIFQKFYRADNSDTRTIGGTGLGLYLVKQRAEAMGGRVWAESAFGEGSTFFVSLPRITNEEYEKRMIMVRNQKMQEEIKAEQAKTSQPTVANVPASSQQPATQSIPPIAQITSTPTSASSGQPTQTAQSSTAQPAPDMPVLQPSTTQTAQSTPPSTQSTQPIPTNFGPPDPPVSQPAQPNQPNISTQPISQNNNNLNGVSQ